MRAPEKPSPAVTTTSHAHADDRHEGTLRQLYATYGSMVQQVCLGYAGGRVALADDLRQEVFLRVWRGLRGFRGEASAKTWLYRITVNTCLEEVRRQARRAEVELPDGLVSGGGGPETAYERLYAAIGELPRLDRLLLMLQLDGQTNAQIATVTGLTANNVRVRTHRARGRLKALLTP